MHAAAVSSWLAWPLRGRCARVLLELPYGLDSAATEFQAEQLLQLVSAATDVPVLPHGEGTSCWPAVRYAARHGLATRIGLEDTLDLPDGAQRRTTSLMYDPTSSAMGLVLAEDCRDELVCKGLPRTRWDSRLHWHERDAIAVPPAAEGPVPHGSPHDGSGPGEPGTVTREQADLQAGRQADKQTADKQTADTQTADTQTADTQTADTQTADKQTADKQSDDQILPFRVDVAQADLDDLRDRLARTRWPGQLPGAAWSRGVPTAYLRELADYWLTRYDWRIHEARLNSFPQFTTTIDGQRMHFLHVRSPEPAARPLLITHGWPGSVVEFLEILLPLTDPRSVGADPADAFHVVAPSIPGYGFSGPVHDVGWNTRRVARAFAALMARLGYSRYAAQGGDWGSAISRDVGVVDGEHVVGVHLNMLTTPPPDSESERAALTDDERERLATVARFRADMAGYSGLQRTRPQTLAYGLTDSPIGQLAWIVEKFREWTDSTSVPEDAVDRDQMLTNVMIYWLTATAGSSAGFYYENSHPPAQLQVSTTPTAVAVFPHDLTQPIRRLAERTNRIERWTEFDRGGHFAAMEEPDLLVDDVRAFFRTLAW